MKRIEPSVLTKVNFAGRQALQSSIVPATPMPLFFTQLKTLNDNQEYDVATQTPIRLPWQDRSFAVRFAAVNFTAPAGSLYYSYRLSPNDETWKSLGHLNELIFSNLNAGDYELQIRAADNNQNRLVSEASLQLHIATPWWNTWWAWIVYAFLLIGAAWLLYRQLLRQQLALAEAARFKELDDLKTSFYTNITHELRTPLTIILGMVNQIRKRPEQHLPEGLNMIQRNGQQLLNLVNQMLDLRKLEVGRMQLRMQQGDIVAYIGKIARTFEAYARSKDIKLHFLPAQPELVMDFDPDQLLNILSNLLSNAIKFTPGQGDIYLQLSKEQQQLKIQVRDTGIGIPTDQLDRIFDRFTQVDHSSTRKAEGTGVGLALTKELVKLWKGSIEVESTINEGTCFTLLLPISQSAKAMDTSEALLQIEKEVYSGTPFGKYNEATESASTSSAAEEEKKELLIVEDNPDLRR
ncbi:MAG: ATP-binding protein, partial [Bacteroidota bacterium]